MEILLLMLFWFAYLPGSAKAIAFLVCASALASILLNTLKKENNPHDVK